METNEEIEFPEEKPRSASRWILGLLGCGALLVLGCGGGLAWLVTFGLGVVTEQVADELRDNEVVLEHIGEIETFELDYGESFSTEGENDFIFNVEGTKGKGSIFATSVTTSAETEEVTAGVLTLDSGEVYDLFP